MRQDVRESDVMVTIKEKNLLNWLFENQISLTKGAKFNIRQNWRTFSMLNIWDAVVHAVYGTVLKMSIEHLAFSPEVQSVAKKYWVQKKHIIFA